MILGMKSLREVPKPSNRHCKTVEDYLRIGEPIHIHFSELDTDKWSKYETSVRILLMTEVIIPWLQGPINHYWSHDWHQYSREQDRNYAPFSTWITRAKARLDRVAAGGGVIFWITHVTAALAFGLMMKPCVMVNGSQTCRLLHVILR